MKIMPIIVVVDIFSFKKIIPNKVGQSKLPAFVETVTIVRLTFAIHINVNI